MNKVLFFAKKQVDNYVLESIRINKDYQDFVTCQRDLKHTFANNDLQLYINDLDTYLSTNS